MKLLEPKDPVPIDKDRFQTDRHWAVKSFPERIKNKYYIDKRGCWIWLGSRYINGYGKIGGSIDKVPWQMLVHRASYLHFIGDPGDNFVCHNCDRPPCFNPGHLYLGDYKSNHHDMMNRKRNGYIPHSGETNGYSKLTVEQVESIRQLYKDGKRQVGLAKEFKVSQACISKIVRYESWIS